MYVISIGTDRSIFDTQSAVYQRIVSYGSFCKKMKVVVFTRKSMGFQRIYIGEYIEVIPTNSISRFLYVFDAIRIIKKLFLHEDDTDSYQKMVTCQDPFETGLVGYVISKKYNIPLHVQIHTDIGSAYFQTESFLNRIRMLIARVVLRRARAIRVVSPSVCDYVVRTYNIPRTNISILPIVHTFEALPRIEKENPYILIVSRLEKEKRIDLALLVCKSALMQNASLKIKIAGTGTEEQYLRSYVTNIGIEDRVEFLGHVSVMAPLYAGARALLHTSLYEGFGLVLYEAMQARCPIVTTNVGIAESLRDAGYDISVCDVADISCLEQNIASIAKMFATSPQPVVLDFMPRSEQEYVELYKDSVVSALTKMI